MLPFKTLLLFVVIFITPAYGGGVLKENKKLWLLLLHFREGESAIDDPSFFLHPKGKYNPEAELEETLNRLKRDPTLRCRFPARAFFIERFLGVKLPKENCPELERFMDEIRGNRVSIVFADSHINSPASMFGHTFIRVFDKEDRVDSYIVNYAAHVDDSNAVLYAFKGLFGFYKGYFTVAPFYLKIKEYSGIEGRDLWEYELEGKREYIYLLKLHLWELKDIYSYYYFFHENCSTEVFYLLNFLNPEDRFELKTPWTVPLDTVKLLIEKGYVKDIRFEPSLLTKLRAKENLLSEEDIDTIKAWVQGEKELPEGKSPLFYEFASDYVRFLYYGQGIDLKTYRRKFLQSLKLRSRSGLKRQSPTPSTSPPHNSHDSQRARLSLGFDGAVFTELSYRPVYHDLLDIPEGYKNNAEIVFSELSLRYYKELNRTLINKWTIVKISSLEPVLSFYRPLSWTVDFGIYRRLDSNGKVRGVLSLKSGGGYTVGSKSLSLFVIGGGGAFTNREGKLGGEVNLKAGILHQGRTLSLLLTLTGGRLTGSLGDQWLSIMSAGMNVPISRSLSLRAEGFYESVGRAYRKEFSLSTLVYF